MDFSQVNWVQVQDLYQDLIDVAVGRYIVDANEVNGNYHWF